MQKYTKTKYPREYFHLNTEFVGFQVSESIVSGSVIAYNNLTGDQVSGSTIIDISKTVWGDNYVQTFVISGSIDTTYRLEYVATTNQGRVYQENGYINVRTK